MVAVQRRWSGAVLAPAPSRRWRPEQWMMLRESAESLCTTWLRDQIMSGALSPGERILPEEIAGRLGVSRMPVREALRLLDAEGLVTLRANRGAVVTRLEPQDLSELFEMRALIEGLCARHAARRATPADIDDLDHAALAMRRALDDPQQWRERHSDFHERLCALSGMPRAAAEARRLRMMITPSLRIPTLSHPTPDTVGHEHEVMVDALRRGDPALCEQVTATHIRANGAVVVGRLTAPPRQPAIAPAR